MVGPVARAGPSDSELQARLGDIWQFFAAVITEVKDWARFQSRLNKRMVKTCSGKTKSRKSRQHHKVTNPLKPRNKDWSWAHTRCADPDAMCADIFFCVIRICRFLWLLFKIIQANGMSINMEALFVGILRTHIGHDIFFSGRKLVIVICKHESINHHVEILLLKTIVMSPCSHSVTKVYRRNRVKLGKRWYYNCTGHCLR